MTVNIELEVKYFLNKELIGLTISGKPYKAAL